MVKSVMYSIRRGRGSGGAVVCPTGQTASGTGGSEDPPTALTTSLASHTYGVCSRRNSNSRSSSSSRSSSCCISSISRSLSRIISIKCSYRHSNIVVVVVIVVVE